MAVVIGKPLILGGGMSAYINVTCPEGTTLTCTNGVIVLTATASDGTYRFRVHKKDSWTIKGTDSNGAEDSVSVLISEDGQVESVEVLMVRVYGISRNITSSSPAWTRTDRAVDMTLRMHPKSVNAIASDFDDVMPWAGIERVTLSCAEGIEDVMVRIPKFYYKRARNGNTESIQIADGPRSGFSIHPLFYRAGKEYECAYVGAYKTSTYTRSVKYGAPDHSARVGWYRDKAALKGAGWGILDHAAFSAIQMLMLVECATNDVQMVIGEGYTDKWNETPLVAGTCDSVPNLFGHPSGDEGTVDVVWRGIEGLWGNVCEYVDGLLVYDGVYYVCEDPAKYAGQLTSDYKDVGYVGTTTWTSAFIKYTGLSNAYPHIMLPTNADGGSSSTYYCDRCSASNGLMVVSHGGMMWDGVGAGLFTIDYTQDTGSADNYYGGSRLMYMPS